MNKKILKLKNGDFEVVSKSYDIPIKYVNSDRLQSGVESGRVRGKSKKRND